MVYVIFFCDVLASHTKVKKNYWSNLSCIGNIHGEEYMLLRFAHLDMSNANDSSNEIVTVMKITTTVACIGICIVYRE